MKYFIKLYKILYFLIYKIFRNFVSFLLIKFDLYFSFFLKFYIEKSYDYFYKNKKKNLENINQKILFRLLKNQEYIEFFSTLYNQSVKSDFGWELAKISYMSQEIIKKMFKVNQKTIFTPNGFGKFGHSLLIDLFIRGQITNILENNEIIIAGNKKLYSNYEILKQLFKNKVSFRPNFLNISANEKIFNNCEAKLNYFKTKSGEYLDLRKYFCKLQLEWEKKNFENYIKLEKIYEIKGFDFLKKYQIDLNKNWYVLLNIRENEKSFELRNSNFRNYIKAIHYIIKRGGFVIRYGKRSNDTKKVKIKNFLDLRGNDELNQMLPFLIKYAKFQISTGSGPSVLPMLLNTPNLLTNWCPITHVVGTKKDLLLPKMFFNSEGKVINYLDRLSDKFGSLETNYMANLLKIDVKENSEEDINFAVNNMFEKCDNQNFKIGINQNKFKNKMMENNFYPIDITNSIEKNYPDFFNEY